MYGFYWLVSWSIWHRFWVCGMCTFCSRASRIAVTWDFSGGNILQISQLELIIQNLIMFMGLECIAKYLGVILTPNLGLYDE